MQALTQTGHTTLLQTSASNDVPELAVSHNPRRHNHLGKMVVSERQGIPEPGNELVHHYSLGSVGDWMFARWLGLPSTPQGPVTSTS